MKAKILILILITIIVVGVLFFASQNFFAPKSVDQDWRTGTGTARQPPSGLAKNLTVFNQYFSNIVLVTDGWSGVEDATESFSSIDNVIVLSDAKSTVTILVYIDDAGNRGLFTGVEKEQNLTVGLTAINLGKFQPSSYVVRVIVNDVCVENLVFGVA